MFRTQNLYPKTKMFLTSGKNIFCFRAVKLFPQHVSRAAKLGNICFRNNVFSQAFRPGSNAVLI